MASTQRILKINREFKIGGKNIGNLCFGSFLVSHLRVRHTQHYITQAFTSLGSLFEETPTSDVKFLETYLTSKISRGDKDVTND